MSRHNEFLILKSSGVSIRRILRPALNIVLLFSVFLLVYNEWGLPIFVEAMHHNQASLQRRKRFRNLVLTDTNGTIVYIGKYDGKKLMGQNLFAIKYVEGKPVITEAEYVRYDFDRGWVLGKGLVRKIRS